jgi:enamine deaminase RidA (YjgF/YER057c/UK114 family)
MLITNAYRSEENAMITDRIDPPELLKIPEIVNVSVATGTRIIHISGQTSVGTDGKVIGDTHLDQSRHAFRNVRTALEAVGATLADVAKFNIYMVNYSWEALEALMTAGKEVFGDPYPLTANTLVGVASLWLPELLVEVDAVAVV